MRRASSISTGSDDHQRPSLAPDQAKAWIRLITVMTVPALWLLLEITLFR